MEVSARRLPRLLLVLVLAFAPYERRPLLAASQLFRGMALQLSYRWAAGRVLAETSDRAVLLWSVCGRRERRELPREVAGVLAAVATGLVLVVASNALLLMVVRAVLLALGTTPDAVDDAGMGVVGLRLALTLWQAVLAYRHQARLSARLPAQTGLRWRLDLIAASPAGQGHGRGVLTCLLQRADAVDAEVVLHCDSRNLSFYRRAGFAVAEGRGSGGQLLLLRPRRIDRASRAATDERASWQAHLAKRRSGRR